MTSEVPLFAVHCPPWDPNKIDKKDGALLTDLNFRKKIVSSDKRKHNIAEVSNFSVTSCLLKALKIELTTPPPLPPHSERNAWEKTLNIP